MYYHPLVVFQCPYHPNKIFYTKESLVNHCKKFHVLCDLCENMLFDQSALEDHYSRKHPKSPPQKPVPADPAAASSPIPADKPEEEQLEPSEGDQARQVQPDPKPSTSKTTDRPDHNQVGRYICSFCKMKCDMLVSYKLHLVQHKKVLCKFCNRNFLNTDSMQVHVSEKHHDKKQPQYQCKVRECNRHFVTQVESFEHLRIDHRSQFRFRCRSCMDSFTSLEDLPIKGVWQCSICAQKFNDMHQLMDHTGTHDVNGYQCDECNWKFKLIAELMIHGRDIHATRKHACYYCPLYFSSGEQLWKHKKDVHFFECENCNEILPSAYELEAHQIARHGKPITEEDTRHEQQREAAEKRKKKEQQKAKREEAAKAERHLQELLDELPHTEGAG